VSGGIQFLATAAIMNNIVSLLSTRLLVAALLSAVSFENVLAIQDYCLCCLCDNCVPVVSGRGDFPIAADGTTCDKLYIEMDPANQSTANNDRLCESLKSQFRMACCDASYQPDIVEQNLTPAPNFGFAPGIAPRYNICHDGSYPSKPFSQVIALEQFLSGGLHTCDELFHMGITGNIPDQICYPLVDFADKPCGCNDTTIDTTTSTTSPAATGSDTTS
jgi:hypothetical protein